jgi:hypothetical protein
MAARAICPLDVRGKLAPHSSPGILVGYASPSQGKNAVYRMWNTAQGKVGEAIDLYFDERPHGCRC